jgi:hypothetical protein
VREVGEVDAACGIGFEFEFVVEGRSGLWVEIEMRRSEQDQRLYTRTPYNHNAKRLCHTTRS